MKYLYDGLGSVTELIDESENVVNSYSYSPFGEALVRDETVYNPHQFTGRQYDAESGLYHYRARAYSPETGRFLQQDPAGMVDGANMYAYVGNNPVNRVDPSGTWVADISRGVSGHMYMVNHYNRILEYCTEQCHDVLVDVPGIPLIVSNVDFNCFWNCIASMMSLNYRRNPSGPKPHEGYPILHI